MASPMAVDKLCSNLAVTIYECDPGDTNAHDVAWVDMRDYERILMAWYRTTGTSDATFAVHANAESDGSGTDVTIDSSTVSTKDPDLEGDYIFFEVTAEQIAQEAADAGVANPRYITLVYTLATNTDDGVAVYIRAGAKRPHDALTADTVA